MREPADRQMRTKDQVQRQARDHNLDPGLVRAVYAGKGPTGPEVGQSDTGQSQPVQRAPRIEGPVADMEPWVDTTLMRALGIGGFEEPIQQKRVEEKPSVPEPVQCSLRQGGPVADMAPWPDAGFMRALGIGSFEQPIQRKRVDEAPSPADMAACWDQTAALSPANAGLAPIQARAEQVGGDTLGHPVQDWSAVQAAKVAATVASGGGSLPHKDKIQESFGRHDVSGVRAFVGGDAGEQAQAIGASAFATGDAVAFSGTPSLHTAAHEAAHVIQQRAGVVALKGINPSGSLHERHADAVADAVVTGRSAEPLLDAMPSGGGATTDNAIQRGGDPPGGEALQDPLVAAHSLPAFRLDAADLGILRARTNERLSGTKTEFYDAVNRLRGAIEARAKQNMEFVCLILDIGLGVVLPGLGTGLSKIANKLPLKSPELVRKVASPLADEAVARAVIQGATKGATTLLKAYAPELTGAAASSAFLDALKPRFAVGVDRLQDHVYSASDLEVVALFAAFDPAVRNTNTYLVSLAGLVDRFQHQIEPMSQKTFDRTLTHDITRTAHAFYVPDESGTKRLAVLRKKDFAARTVTVSSQIYYDFVSWVSPDMQGIALERTKQVGGQPIEVGPSQIENLEPYGAE